MSERDKKPDQLTSKEAAELLRYSSVAAFRRAARRHRIPRSKVNCRKLLFDRSEIEKWLRQR